MAHKYTEAEVEYITHSRWTGLMTRETLDVELTYIVEDIAPKTLALVAWDVDELKKHNNLWGKPTCSSKMRAGARCSGVELTFHLFSGDEYGAIVDYDDATGLANRVQAGLNAEGMSATFVILEVFGVADVSRYLDDMDEMINDIKAAGGRGTITDYRDEREQR